jgi:SpoVK/Ycf46/Vps4 family AAA+-type ATPase
MFGKAAASVLAKLHGKKPGDVAMLKINGPEIQSPYVGVTEEIVRDIFAYARAYKRLHGHQLVIFIDEADAILPSRDGNGSGRRALPWEESNVATFLTEMDGIEESGALVILATNRPHAIDAALLRDGRCDRRIKVKRPTALAAKVIFTRYLKAAPLTAGHDQEQIAAFAMDRFFCPTNHLLTLTTSRGRDFLTLGDIVNGAMIVGLVERAKSNAFQRDLAAGGKPTGINPHDIERAIESLVEENRGLIDNYALQEFAERIGVDSVQVETINRAQPKIDIRGLN